ncbi:N-acetylmuramoyl-L-alanine amidase [Prosthecobacter debontii]|uniref:N-acetylmuramoyl-L-alanine amidase n=1 Tax=Prosthecobacter debontii TaxID=48467 RepID=A0A1T4Z6F3_9BACT|nr:N-acetylmuramoyl-L-alanine amidase [Prosthecobacter debontii]
MPQLRLILGLCLISLLVSCQSSRYPQGRSVYGDRPGPQAFTTVIVDAGHGGRDSGARARGLVEKQLALDVAKRVRSELWPSFKVVMMRDSDYFVELDNRVNIANRYGNSILVSIHFNYGARRRAGPETYYWRSDSYALARRVQQNLSAVAPYESGNAGLVRRRLRLTRNPALPCILVECGYLTNANEAKLVATSSYRERLAEAIAKAIRDQSQYGDAGMGPIPRPIYAPPSKATDARD